MRALALIGTLALAAPASAADPDTHWSLRPRTRPVVPEVREPKFVIRNPVDAFILFRMETEALSPAPEADRVTLVRRVTFDLTGLPPAPAEVAAFVNDTAPNADEKFPVSGGAARTDPTATNCEPRPGSTVSARCGGTPATRTSPSAATRC